MSRIPKLSPIGGLLVMVVALLLLAVVLGGFSLLAYPFVWLLLHAPAAGFIVIAAVLALLWTQPKENGK